jgi:hypothetical protein
MGRIWAVAKNLIREVMRMRILMISLTLMTLCYTAGFALWLYAGQGRVDEKVQTFLSYSLSISGSVLGFFTIFISAASVSRDLKHREIYMVVTKPISRGGYLAGKLIGLVLLNLSLLGLNGVMIYGLARGLAYFSDGGESEMFRLQELIFVARQSVKPPIPDVSETVRQQVEKVVEQRKQEDVTYQTNPALVSQLRRTLQREMEQQEIMRHRTVPPGGQITWHFEGIRPINPQSGVIIIRYKHDVSLSPPGETVTSQWLFGAADPTVSGGMMHVSRDVIRTAHEFGVSANELSANGDLYVTFVNPLENRPVSVIFPPEDGIEVLFVVGGFEGNFLRTLALQFFRLIFLSILGVAMGAWVSYPVAVLVMMVIYVLGLSNDFIMGAMRWEAQVMQAEITRYVMYVMPRFSIYDPVGAIEKGRLVSWNLVGDGGLELVILKGGLAAGFGYLVFRLRELARIIV